MGKSVAQPKVPIGALATAGYGAVLGSLFPLMVVMTTADISGGLSVAADNGALVVTVQNVGSISGILLATRFAAGIGRGRTMALTGAGFALTSTACAIAPTLDWMLAARLVQGVFSGALPLLFMLTVMTSLRPGAGQFEGMSLFAASTTLFFGTAASVGAFLVDHFGWRSLFWAQAIAILPYCWAATRVLREEKGRFEVLRRTDWGTYSLLTVGLGMILFAISEGERHFWLDAWWVPGLMVGGAVLTGFATLNLIRDEEPLLVLAVFRRTTFSWGIIFSLVFRFGSMFAIFVVPSYLGRVQGFRPAEIGQVLSLMFPASAVGLVAAWAFGRYFDSRRVLSAGLGLFAAASLLCVNIGPDWAVDQLSIAALVAGLGMGLFAVSVLRFAALGATIYDGPTVGVIFNLTRVFGLSGGLAVLSHLVIEREKFHSAVIAENLAATNPETADRLASVAGAFARFSSDASAAQQSAAASLARAASGQAFTLAFADAFIVTAIVLAVGAAFVWALPSVPPEVIRRKHQRSFA